MKSRSGVGPEGSRSGEATRFKPTYAAAFRCIGPSCEDPCCEDWDIPVDKATYARYKQFPPDKLGAVVDEFVFLHSGDKAPAQYAQIYRKPSGSCPFLGADRLCGIQKEYGPGLLSATCSIYPRSLSRVDGELEGSLSLSCPEAARNVLLNPGFMEVEGNLFSGEFRTDNSFGLAGQESGSTSKPYAHFHEVRGLLIEIVRDRSKPLWQRLMLIGSLCKRLDEIATVEQEPSVPRILRDFRRILEEDDARVEFESMPRAPRIRLEVVLALSDERVRDKERCGSRFRDTFWTFVEGIGSSEESAPGDDLDRFRQAEERYYGPFFARSPFMLENYLLNYMLQHLFPFGRAGSAQFDSRSLLAEWVLMTTQFAWVNGLLIGVAGHYGESFCEEHVVRTVQSFTRAVEHTPDVLYTMLDAIGARRLNSFEGMAILLRS